MQKRVLTLALFIPVFFLAALFLGCGKSESLVIDPRSLLGLQIGGSLAEAQEREEEAKRRAALQKTLSGTIIFPEEMSSNLVSSVQIASTSSLLQALAVKAKVTINGMPMQILIDPLTRAFTVVNVAASGSYKLEISFGRSGLKTITDVITGIPVSTRTTAAVLIAEKLKVGFEEILSRYAESLNTLNEKLITSFKVDLGTGSFSIFDTLGIQQEIQNTAAIIEALASPTATASPTTVASSTPPIALPSPTPTAIPVATPTVSLPSNQPPQISITAPINGAILYRGNDLEITAVAIDPDGTIANVEFFQGETSLGKISQAPFSTLWKNIPAGTWALSAKATDNALSAAKSATIQVTVQTLPNTPPQVRITSPVDGVNVEYNTAITIVAEASDTDGTISKIEIYNETGKLVQCATSPCQFVWGNPAPGSHSLSAKAFDNQGLSQMTASLTFTVTQPALVSLSLNPVTAALNINSGFDLSSMRVTANYANNTASNASNLTWSISSGGGAISGNTYNTPSSSGTAELIVVYTESGITRSASFPITLGLYPLTWSADLEAAKDVSSTTNRNIFISFHSTVCAWSIQMDNNTYSNPDIANILNSDFIPVRIVLQNSSTSHYFNDYSAGGTPVGIVLKARTLTVLKTIDGYQAPASFTSLLNGTWK